MAFVSDPAASFNGTPRFQLLRRLGAGGMGVVYEALDRERGERVALKTLREMGAGNLLRFKKEFRALQDLRHLNLVSLGQLALEGGAWFFTMELVDGLPFLDFVRGGAWPTVTGDAATVDAAPSGPTVPWDTLRDARDAEPINTPVALGRPADVTRLREALRQLCAGVVALHAVGKIHRDIKPSNVLVTSTGRVVLLDFGLAVDFEQGAERAEWTFAGTPGYMAPEQASGGRVGPPADWYAFGVMLYEALTGQAPHQGTFLEVLRAKQTHAPAPARTLAPDAPADLLTLSDELLRLDPEARPTGASLLARLGVPGTVTAVRPGAHFVGREAELRALTDAWVTSQRGQPVTVFIHGDSGVGKTALVKHFTDRLRETEGVGVLWGRYYERELVPFKAFDGIMDDLVRLLGQLPAAQRRACLPDELPFLASVFPVLTDLRPGLVSSTPPLDPQELRRRLHRGIRMLLQRVAREHPLVLVVDDAQWADRDSRALFAGVMRPGAAPPVLVLATDRVEPERRAQWLSAQDQIGDVRQLVVGSLPRASAQELAEALLGAHPAAAAAIAEEAQGHPLFIRELALQTLRDHAPTGGPPRLADVLRRRVSELPATERRLVVLGALSPGPLALDVAAAAGELDLGALEQKLGELRLANLLRPSRCASGDALEPYHDRVRAAALSLCEGDARREAHARLADSYEAREHDDPEALATHWLGAGDAVRAAHYLTRTAERTAHALAFDQAAHLYEQAIALDDEPARRRPRQAALGHVLVSTGRGEAGARAYLAAAEGADDRGARELRRRAADQLLRSGQIDLGLQTARDALAAVGLRLARTPRGALIGLLGRRLQLRLRGLRFRERGETELTSETLERVDLCWAIAGGLALVDTIRGAHFQTRHLLLALAAGEPMRVARALAAEAAFSSADGGPAAARTQRLSDEARRLAARVGHPYAIGWAEATTGFAAALEGRWADARARCDEAEQVLRGGCTGIAWELSTIHFWRTAALSYLGELRALKQRVDEREREAVDRSDLFGATCVRTNYATLAWLAADDPEGGLARVERSMRDWSREGFHVEHWWELVSRSLIGLYTGSATQALAAIDLAWTPLRRGLLLRVQLSRIEALSLRARCALAAARENPTQASALHARARADAHRIARERMPWSAPIAEVLLASLAASDGRPDEATAHLVTAHAGFTSAGMALHAAVAQRRRGELVSGEVGAALRAGADAWMAREGVRDATKLCAVIAPGFAP